MRKILVAAAAIGMLAGCSQAEPDYQTESYAVDVEEEASMDSAESVAPDIEPTAAPGVAFDYSVAIGVPDANISRLQEKHADACEAMGLSRCQIVGMQYDLQDIGRSSGQLTFLLGRADARVFARDAVKEAEKMDGALLSSQFSGEEVQTAIAESVRRADMAKERLAEIERTLNQKGLSDDRRAQLESEAAGPRGQRVPEQQSQQANQRRIAMSPLTIDYIGEHSYGRTPFSQIFGEAWDAGRSSLTALFTVLIYLLTVFLPWILVAALIIFAARWSYRRVEAWQAARRGTTNDAGDHPDDA